MSSFAHIIDGMVVNIIIADQSFIDSQDDLYIKYKEDDIIIKNISAEIGYTYNDILDIFIPYQPYPSWSLNDNHVWEPPIPKPEGEMYVWDEENKQWIDFSVLQ